MSSPIKESKATNTEKGGVRSEPPFFRPAVQAKLAVNDAGDEYEREADAVADSVMRLPDGAAGGDLFFKPLIAPVQRKRANFEEEEALLRKPDLPFTRKKDKEGVEPASLPMATRIEAAQRSGQPLATLERTFMESRFGADFSTVSIHTDHNAVQLSRELHAQAFTVGKDIFFNSAKFNPGTAAGRRLLAHELTHTVQQEGGDKQLQRETELDSAGTLETANEPGHYHAGEWYRTAGGLEERYWADFVVDEHGEMRADVRTTRPQTQPATPGGPRLRSPQLRLSEQFPAAMRYFQEHNVTVNSFRGVWDTMTDTGELSDNLVRFNNAMRQNPGMTEAQAAFETPSGRAARAQGLTNAEVLINGRNPATGEPVDVHVVFSRPGFTPAPARGGTSSTETPVRTELPVQTRFTVLNSEARPNGTFVTEVEALLGEGLAGVNEQAASHGARSLPARIILRITTNAEGALVAAESTSGEAAGLLEVLARRALATLPRTVAAGAAAGTVSPWVRGASWAGLAVFLGITYYHYRRAPEDQRPRVLASAGGSFVGGMATGYLFCNLALGIETAGWSLLICGFIAGIPGGMLGHELGGLAYDEATATPLTRALHDLQAQPANVRSLFYSMVQRSGAPSGLPVTEEFVRGFIRIVPANLSTEEVDVLSGQLAAIGAGTTLQEVLNRLGRAIQALPARRPLPPVLTIMDVTRPGFTLPYRLDALGSGRIRILPAPVQPPRGLDPMPGTRSPTTTLLEIQL